MSLDQKTFPRWPTQAGTRVADRGFARAMPPTRQYRQWAGSVLLVVVCVLLAALLWTRHGDPTEVLVVARPVAPGEVIEAADLRPAEVSGVGDAVAASQTDSVVGQRAAVGLVEGQVLTNSAVTSQTVPAPEERMVALELRGGLVPAGLRPGAVVRLLAIPAEGTTGDAEKLENPPLLAEDARVFAVTRTDQGTVVVSVLVDPQVADAVAAHAAAGQVAVVQSPLVEE